jgi:hypothetical protein
MLVAASVFHFLEDSVPFFSPIDIAHHSPDEGCCVIQL